MHFTLHLDKPLKQFCSMCCLRNCVPCVAWSKKPLCWYSRGRRNPNTASCTHPPWNAMSHLLIDQWLPVIYLADSSGEGKSQPSRELWWFHTSRKRGWWSLMVNSRMLIVTWNVNFQIDFSYAQNILPLFSSTKCRTSWYRVQVSDHWAMHDSLYIWPVGPSLHTLTSL